MAKQKSPKAGPKRYVEYKEAEERTVQQVRYWHSPPGGQAVIIQFTDGTCVHIAIEPIISVKTEVGALRDGDLKIDKTYAAIIGSPVR